MQDLVFLWLTEGNIMHLISSFCVNIKHTSLTDPGTHREICALFSQYAVMLLRADRHPLNDLNTSVSLSI